MGKLIKDVNEFIDKNRSFIEYLKEWEENLKDINIKKIIKDAGGAQRVSIISVDLIEGFARIGPLASPRVLSIINPAVEIFKEAYNLGVRDFILAQDSHKEETPEFDSYPPHCLEGSKEAETVKEIKELPFFNDIKIIPKNSISTGIDTDIEKHILNKGINKIIVVGDCTDLCTYQLAMFLRLTANALHLPWEIILPINAVDTYDLPVKIAKEIGANAHPGDFFHITFLYHMYLNGINVVRKINF